jgi:hypothetical protein
VEGYTELISWSRIDNRDIWDLRKQIDVVRIASYFGHREIVDVSLQQNPNSSSNNVLVYSAVLGCAEAGRAIDMALFLDQNLKSVTQIHVPSDPFINAFKRISLRAGGFVHAQEWKGGQEFEKEQIEMQRNISASLVGCVVYASLQAWNQNIVQEREVQVCATSIAK